MLSLYWSYNLVDHHFGLRSTRITESPRMNILLRKRSLLTVLAFLTPFPVFGTSVHSSFTFSSTMLQCLSKAFTRPRSFRLFLQLISTCALVFTLCVKTDKGPAWKSRSSFFSTWEEQPLSLANLAVLLTWLHTVDNHELAIQTSYLCRHFSYEWLQMIIQWPRR